MTRNRHKRAALVFFALLALLIAVPVVLTWRQVRQEQLNDALIDAAKQADDRAAISLLERGADPNCRDEPTPDESLKTMLLNRLTGRNRHQRSDAPTPLTYAAGANAIGTGEPAAENTTLVLALLQHGADANARSVHVNLRPANVLWFAVMARRSKTVHLLLEHGAKVDPSRSGLSFYASFGGDDVTVIRDLIEHGADVNDGAGLLGTPLMSACGNGDLPAVKVLLTNHADVNLKDNQGETALDLAHNAPSPQRFEIIRLLKAAGARK